MKRWRPSAVELWIIFVLAVSVALTLLPILALLKYLGWWPF